MKKYVAKVYREGSLLTTWENELISDFSYTQAINSAGSVVDLELARDPDTVGGLPPIVTKDYYFNAFMLLSGTWSSMINAFNNNEFNDAFKSGVKDDPTSTFFGEGTTAPGSNPDDIVSVRVSFKTSKIGDCDFDGIISYDGETLLTRPLATGVSSWFTLDEPTGGWTWDKVSELRATFSFTPFLASSASVFYVRLEVDTRKPTNLLGDVALNNFVDIFVYYEDSYNLITHLQEELVTDSDDVLIAEEGAPMGRRIFSGYIASFTPSYQTNTTALRLYSHGEELDNYIIFEGTDPSRLAERDTNDIGASTNYQFGGVKKVAQTFIPSESGSIEYVHAVVWLSNAMFIGQLDAELRWSIVEGTPATPGVVLGTAVQTLSQDSPILPISSVTSFTPTNGVAFTTPVDVVMGETYHIQLEQNVQSLSSEAFLIGSFQTPAGGDIYANGSLFTSNDNGTTWSNTGRDALFNVFQFTINTRVPFLSTDPSDMLRTLLDSYNSRGGLLSYTNETIIDTATNQSFTFNTNTILEGIQEVLRLTPPVGNWYWFVDMGANLVHLKPQATTPDHVFTLGKEIQAIDVQNTIEELTNDVFIQGGEDGLGKTIFRRYQDTNSINKYRRGLRIISDSRLTVLDTFETIASIEFERNASERYRTTITINDALYNIENIKLGQMIAFQGFDDYIDDLLLQVAQLNYSPNQVTLVLDSLPPSVNRNIDVIRRSLRQLESSNNPDSPS